MAKAKACGLPLIRVHEPRPSQGSSRSLEALRQSADEQLRPEEVTALFDGGPILELARTRAFQIVTVASIAEALEAEYGGTRTSMEVTAHTDPSLLDLLQGVATKIAERRTAMSTVEMGWRDFGEGLEEGKLTLFQLKPRSNT